MDAYVFDQIYDNEESIDATMEKAKRRRKRYQCLFEIMAITHTIGGFEFDEELSDEFEDL